MQPISLEDLKQRIDSRETCFMLVDARDDDAYESEHVPGARNVAPITFRERIDEVVGRDDEIVVYADDSAASRQAGEQLEELGYTRVFHLEDGLDGWKKAGNETWRG